MQTHRQESHARAISQRRSRPGLRDEAHGKNDLLSSLDILPVQLHCSPYNLYHEMGETLLMCAVLQDAINCLQWSVVSDTRRARRLAREAEEWVFSHEDGYVFSFVNICTVLGLDPEYLRLGLKRWRQGHVVRPPRGRLSVVRRSQPSNQTV
jgi:hypothetical protein